VSGRTLAAALAIAIGGAALLGTQLPFIWASREARLARHPDVAFTGALPTYADDCFTYWSWMRQARDGRFLFEDLYTTEAHPRNYVNVLFWSLGTFGRVTGVSERSVYAAARVALSAALLFALWVLAGRLFSKPLERATAFAFFVVQGGWAGVADVFERNWHTAHVTSPEWWTPEMSTAFSMMLFPHFLAGFVCIIGTTLLALRAWRAQEAAEARVSAVLAGLVMTLLTFFHPYDVVPLVATLWLAAAFAGIQRLRWPAREIETAAVATGVLLPALLYNYWIFSSNPAMRAWDLQNLMITSEPARLAISLGIGGALAVLALVRFRAMPPPILYMAAWFVADLVLIHLPVRFQRRMIGGVQFPVGALAAFALASFAAPWLSRRLAEVRPLASWRKALGAAPLGACTLAAGLAVFPLQAATPWRVVHLEWAQLRRLRYPSWVRSSELQAFRALERSGGPAGAVLCSYEMGGLVPPSTGRRPYLGHYALTIDAQRKGRELERFFAAGPEDDSWRLELLARAGVTHVLWTAHERVLGAFDPTSRPWLKEVFRSGTGVEDAAVLYAVDSGTTKEAAPASESPRP
jgi:hypothetical protein